MKKILVLGGGADQADLILELKTRGYYTILVDYYENPIAKSVADEHVQESTLDKEKVLEIARDKRVENVITACTDQALLTVAYVAEKLGFKTQFSYQEALNITNKTYMKKKMWEARIPTSKFICVSSIHSRVDDLHFPLVVKPADSNGSLGVRKANSLLELRDNLQSALEISRSKTAIIEEYKNGNEVSVDCYVINGETKIIMMSSLKKKNMGKEAFLIFQSEFPAYVNRKAEIKIQQIAQRIVEAFELDNTPLLIQVIVDSDEVNVVEFSARIGGGSKHRDIRIYTGFDILRAYVSSYFGESPNTNTLENQDLFSRNYLYTKPSTLAEIKGYEEILQENLIEDFVKYKTNGMTVGNSLASRDRAASFLVKARKREELKIKILEVIKKVKIYNTNSDEILLRSIFEDEEKVPF